MPPSELHRAVSRHTGDDQWTIRNRGFSLVDESAPLDEEDWDALIRDWDRLAAPTAQLEDDDLDDYLTQLAPSHGTRHRTRRKSKAIKAATRLRRAV